MTESSEILTRLSALPDAELAAVLRAATAGRGAFWAVHAALAELAGVGHADVADAVSPATPPARPEPGTPGSGQVGGPVPPPPVASPPSGAGGYTSSGMPTFDSVRDKVEQRFGTAQGRSELDRETPVGRSVDEQFAAREEAARERLDRIRRSLHGEGAD
ncbi:hypothetical protein [Nocardia farcinica]|uniref:Uncharacterized protein n=1 Tax=Nocardia farcinica (strain IFM 10152) TaxID=247156 RepID=Q5YYG9_NOCFA|nr:hypothetical protein [Nocardia farcinica]BAD56772.1 hypothetical protein NFA_19260 [Nocardia farcinica IFM 10152]